MDLVSLLRQAREAGLRISTDGPRLVVRGPRSAGPLARRLLAQKEEILAALVGGPPAAMTSRPEEGWILVETPLSPTGRVVFVRREGVRVPEDHLHHPTFTRRELSFLQDLDEDLLRATCQVKAALGGYVVSTMRTPT